MRGVRNDLPVERRRSFLANHHDLSLEAMFPQTLHGVMASSTSTNDDYGLLAALLIRLSDGSLVRL